MASLSSVLASVSTVSNTQVTNNSISSLAGQFASLLEQFLQNSQSGSKLEIGITSNPSTDPSGTQGFTIEVQEIPGASAASTPAAQSPAPSATEAPSAALAPVVQDRPPALYDPPPAVKVLTHMAAAPSLPPVLQWNLESRLQQLVPQWEPGIAPYVSGVDRQYVTDSFRQEAKYWTSIYPDTAVDPAAQEAMVQKYSGMVFDWMAQAPASYWGNGALSGSVLDHLAELPAASSNFTPAAIDPVTRQITFPVTAGAVG